MNAALVNGQLLAGVQREEESRRGPAGDGEGPVRKAEEEEVVAGGSIRFHSRMFH